MVDHDIVRLDIPVHDALAVAEVERLEQLVDVEAHVVVGELGVQAAEVGVVDGFEYQRGGLALESHSISTKQHGGHGREEGIPNRQPSRSRH